MMRYGIALFVFQSACQLNADRPGPAPGWCESHILHDGLLRYYCYYLPQTIK